jgi:hypothetical protein
MHNDWLWMVIYWKWTNKAMTAATTKITQPTNTTTKTTNQPKQPTQPTKTTNPTQSLQLKQPNNQPTHLIQTCNKEVNWGHL